MEKNSFEKSVEALAEWNANQNSKEAPNGSKSLSPGGVDCSPSPLTLIFKSWKNFVNVVFSLVTMHLSYTIKTLKTMALKKKHTRT